MKKMNLQALFLVSLLAGLLLPALSLAAAMNDYCITPPFITAGVKPNLLLMLDNSSSMYDLAYVDKGKKHCAIAGTDCFYDSDCTGTGDSCSVFDRSPYYCFDQTYSNANNYYGYFDKDKFYYYRPLPNDDFAEVASAFPSGCGSVAAGSTTKTIAGTMCLEYLGSDVKSFVAKGNYLNWLTASKFDVEKKILTGGVFDPISKVMTPQSRGCVGRGYIKNANTADFVNFSGDPVNDTNNSLEVTFTVTGPANSASATAPSVGGQTYINLYAGSTYNYADCQKAMDAISSGNNAVIKKTVDACLSSSGAVSGKCQQNMGQDCTTSPDCVLNTAVASTVKVCADGTGKTCVDDSDCSVAARNACQNDTSMACSGLTDTTSCKINTAEAQGSCGAWSPALVNGSQAPTKCDFTSGTAGNASTTVNNGDGTYSCKYKKNSNDVYHYASCSYKPATSVDKGPCVFSAAQNFGLCKSNYTGPCVLPAAAVATKSKVSFQQSMQACWAMRNGTAIGGDDILTVINQCSDVYGSYATCSNNHLLTCEPTAANSCGAGNTCQTGPLAITAGNHALLCGSEYEGQYYQQVGSAWVLRPGYDKDSPEMIATHTQFCIDMDRPNVTDPTDAPSNTITTDTMPAILSGVGVEAQLGAPKATMKARVAVATPACTSDADCPQNMLTGQFTSCVGGVCTPSGLLQKFGNNIRLGAMKFNVYGSASETALTGTGTPKTCKSGTTNAGQICTQDVECAYPAVAGNCTATGTVNYDGGRVVYQIGRGYCATMTTTQCSDNSVCTGLNTCQNTGYCGEKGTTRCATALTCSGSNQACISDGVGDHDITDSLVGVVDGIRAESWTPLAETFYNAIGYFAAVQQADGTFKSRVSTDNDTGMRLNTTPADFDENYNPSESRCQQNYVLLITDGSSTADRNAKVNTMATLYAGDAGIPQTTCFGSPTVTAPKVQTDYGGNNNLPIMAWIARNRRISDVSVAGTKSTTPPTIARDAISTYVVFNGESNGETDDCNPLTLLSKTAAKGGTTLKQANDYPGLVTALTNVFNDVSAKAASGTAASILSNSEGSGANILQAVFYPKKIFEEQTAVNWIGEMQNLWYYVDPYVSNSTIREDTYTAPATVGDLKLNLRTDYVTEFFFDSSADMTKVRLKRDVDGNGTGDTVITASEDPDLVKSIWRAGKQLWSRDLSLSPRNLYTPLISGASETFTGSGLMTFTHEDFPATTDTEPDNSTVLQPYLSTTPNDNATAKKLMKWVHGFDFPGDNTMRSRVAKIGNIPASTVSTSSTDVYVTNPRDKGIGVWKLGDIISSTPRVQSTVRLNTYNLPSPGGYFDKSYESFIGSNQYADRGMVYVGGNDGMLHAFNLGILSVKANGDEKASLTGANKGKEMWAFIPKNYLPYLKYMADPTYPHLYGVDGLTLIADVSIGDTGIAGCQKSNYWNCDKPRNSSVVTTTNNLDSTKNTWRTIVISGMGLGGASRNTCATDATQRCVQTPITDPGNAALGLGYSSYFALDVTDPVNPQFLWEFSNPLLGYATTGPAVVRIGDPEKNGRWFAVFGSGPFGPIDTANHQFEGKSDHSLRFFVVDLRTGQLMQVKDSGGTLKDYIETGIDRAFAGSMIGGGIDADRWNSTTGNYQDDAIYVGYVKNTSIDLAVDAWTQGGVGRIMTQESIDPSVIAWKWSVIKDGIGPVTTAIARSQDRKNMNLWLYFGTGRYYFRTGSGLDDNDSTRTLYGIKEPCYNTPNKPGNYLDGTCTSTLDTRPMVPFYTGAIVDQSTSITPTVYDTKGGWKIDLDSSTTSKVCSADITTTCDNDSGCPSGQTCNKFGAERVVTNTVALTNGTVFFTSFKPTLDLCGYGGNSYLWGVKYDTGGQAASNAMTGKALIQLSTGEFREVNLSEAFTDRLNRRIGSPMTGKPPSDAPPIISNSANRPVKKILHIQEH